MSTGNTAPPPPTRWLVCGRSHSLALFPLASKKVYKRNPQFSKNPYLQDIVSFQTQTQYTFSRERTPSALSESDIMCVTPPLPLRFASLRFCVARLA
jgi:hypothetical protein